MLGPLRTVCRVGRSRRGQRLLVTAVPVCVAVCVALAVVPAGAAADLPVRIDLVNHTVAPHADLALVAAGNEQCWNDGNLPGLGNKAAYRWLAPGQSTSFTMSRSTDFFRGCAADSIFGRVEGWRQLQLLVRDGSDKEGYIPQGQGLFKLVARPGTVHFETVVPTWTPRRDGLGLICMRTYNSLFRPGANEGGEATIEVYNDAFCNSSQRPPKRPISTLDTAATATTARQPAATAAMEGTGNSGAVIDLLSTIGVACPWWAYPGDAAACAQIGPSNPNNWSISNLKPDVRDFRVTGGVGVDDPWVPIGAADLFVPLGSAPGTVGVNKGFTTSAVNTMTTQKGGEVGVSFGFEQSGKVEIPLLAEGGLKFSQSVNSKASFSTTSSEQTSSGESQTVSVSVGAQPGFTTRLDVFSNEREANYGYAADLDFGKGGTVQAVSTPANQALGQSPAARQPCLGYVVGDANVYGSIMQIGNGLLAAGFSPTEPSLSPERRAFLQSVPSFRTQPGDCPGFPAGFAAGAGFKGTGVGTYRSVGFDEKGTQSKTYTGCVYVTPFVEKPAAIRADDAIEEPSTPPSGAAPCQAVTNGGSLKAASDRALASSAGRLTGANTPAATPRGPTPGALLDYRHDDVPAGETLVAPAGSDEIFAPQAGGRIDTNDGALDIVHVGRGSTTVLGGDGDNVFYGGSAGRDVLDGGDGGLNVLIARGARTTMRESGGTAEMFGGSGPDIFRGTNMRGVMFGGSGADTMIATGKTSGVAMTGGSGTNTYEVLGRGTPKIDQLPRDAKRSRLITRHTIRVPLYVASAVAIGGQHVTLTGGQGTRALTANNAGDVLRAGPGAETLRGGRGADQFVLSDENDDIAIGGGGANRYRFTGRPEVGTRPPGLQYPAGRTASTIRDFRPGKGDRLVLSAKVFGARVLRLRHGFRLVAGHKPRPRTSRPTLLFNTRTRILSFDRDGTGPISDQVIVRLRGASGRPRRSWFAFVAR
jgi:Ca2+-binding RTX toxin-like protein